MLDMLWDKILGVNTR